MSDVGKYIKERAERDIEFAFDFEKGYADFKIGIMFREKSGASELDQEKVNGDVE